MLDLIKFILHLLVFKLHSFMLSFKFMISLFKLFILFSQFSIQIK